MAWWRPSGWCDVWACHCGGSCSPPSPTRCGTATRSRSPWHCWSQGGPLAASLAVLIKLYAGIPLLGRWRDLVVAGTVLAVTLVVLPWPLYLDHGLGVDAFTDSWNGSAWRIPVLVPVVALSLWVLRRDGAPWLAVPALFPVTQFYYVAMALPAIRQRRLVAAALALPMVLMTPIVVMLLAAHALGILRLPARLRRSLRGGAARNLSADGVRGSYPSRYGRGVSAPSRTRRAASAWTPAGTGRTANGASASVAHLRSWR